MNDWSVHKSNRTNTHSHIYIYNIYIQYTGTLGAEDIRYMDMIFHKLTVFPMTSRVPLKMKIMTNGDRNLSWASFVLHAYTNNITIYINSRYIYGKNFSNKKKNGYMHLNVRFQ